MTAAARDASIAAMTLPGTHPAWRTRRLRPRAGERFLTLHRSWTGLHEISLFVLFYLGYFGVRASRVGAVVHRSGR